MPISFIRSDASGRMIPMQKVRSVYAIGPDLAGETVATKRTGIGECWVSHFETCPNATELSRKGVS